MVLGGNGADTGVYTTDDFYKILTDISLFIPATKTACRGPDLPHGRHSHTAGEIIM